MRDELFAIVKPLNIYSMFLFVPGTLLGLRYLSVNLQSNTVLTRALDA